ncbi:hypothetical protein Ahy_A10g047974 [Arachis hypogaea]|uniref:Uncharacterized protein n=1 Tax=Arachis hypogaea TaxID=3818 RepID=A0A445B3Z3_ARAHY|nr:hypothetical protein Ahy_A10g047974 [Arachis hypogaea]
MKRLHKGVLVVDDSFCFPRMKEKKANIPKARIPSTEAYYDSSKIMPEVNLESENDHVFQTQTKQSSVNKPNDSIFHVGVEEESFSDSAQLQMIVVWKETHSQSEPLEIVPLQVCLPPSETRAPSPMESELIPPNTPQPHQPADGTPIGPATPSKIQPVPQATVALMMMARAFEKFETPAKRTEVSGDLKEKCFLWATNIKTYADGSTNEWESMLILNAQQPMEITKGYFASLKAGTHIEAENMALGNHEGGEFLHLKTKKPFDIQDYSIFIPYLDMQKLASHPYELGVVRFKIRCVIASLGYNQEYVISKTRVFVGGNLSFDCAVYIMKWLEILELKNIKKDKYDWENWTRVEVDHFRVEYASHILFHEMNQDRDRAIQESEAIRLSKPSTTLLSPYCQLGSDDIDTD